MLRIRGAQVQSLEQASLKQFEDEMVEHLRGFQPGHAQAAGETGLRQLIKDGMQRARKYRFTLRGPIRFYLEQMIQYGHEFDSDPLVPWARHEFSDGGGDELKRADIIHAIAADYHERVVGPERVYEKAAIRHLLGQSVASWLTGDLSPGGIEARIRQVYPQKCAAAPAAALRAVIAASRGRAREHHLPESTGGLVFSALAVALGHGYLTDPVYPWVAGNLRESAGQSPEQRVDKLATRALAFLTGVLADYEQG